MPAPSALGALFPISPVEPIQAPQDVTGVVRALSEARKKNTALQQQLLRAQAIRDQQAQGLGPGGAQQGVGPGGWAITAADAINRALERKSQNDAAARVAAAMGEQSPAVTSLQAEYLKGQPNKYKLKDMQEFVPQGAPMASPFSVGQY